MQPAKILVIEDDDFVARTIERSLRRHAFQVILVNNGVDGLELARQARPNLIVLDVMMRGIDGFTICRSIRLDSHLSQIPVLFLTARGRIEDKIAGLKAGADDYLTKPFSVEELVLRIHAILRRTLDSNQNNGSPLVPTVPTNRSLQGLVVGNYILDTHSFELVTPTRGRVRLTPVQFDLLYHFMTHPEETFTPARLLDEIWDFPTGRGSLDLVRVHIRTLRERIETDPKMPKFLCTVPGRGYMVKRE